LDLIEWQCFGHAFQFYHGLNFKRFELSVFFFALINFPQPDETLNERVCFFEVLASEKG
jgi:hypothetical protein